MRATQRRTAPRSTGFLYVLLGLAGAAGLAACTDAIHLDPPGATSTSGGTGGTRGDGGIACRSNPDCPFPTPICDTVTQTCVQCLLASDCSTSADIVCSLGACQCYGQKTGLSYCGGETPLCVDLQTSPTDCGKCGSVCTTTCAAGSCASGSGGGTGSGGSSSSSTSSSSTSGGAADAGTD